MSGGLKDRGASPEQSSLFKDTDQRSGHRQRLKDRFVSGGPEALPDYELLELVLFNAISRRDTKPMAKRLIERFGSFAEAINAPPERLREVEGIGDSASAIILVHNHPSGDPTPSRADIDMTKQIVDAAKPLGVAIHDHIIVGRQGHASFKGLKLF